MKNCDTVVIGSGMGGLTAAVCHAQAGEKVIVVEQHSVPGGWSHSFSMSGHRFNTGVHYIGELSEGGLLKNIFEGLGLGGDLTFCELNRSGYDHFILEGKRYDFPVGRENLINYLVRLFPHEEVGIKRFLEKTGKFRAELTPLLETESLIDAMKLPFIAPTTLRWMFNSYDSFVRSYIKDEKLIQVLSAHAGDHAMPPNNILATMHVGMLEHYMRGAFYPQGGAYKLPKAFVKALKQRDGEIMLETKVDRILTEGSGRSRKVTGVRLADGNEIRCNKIISNADPHQTFAKMLSVDTLSKRLQRKLKKTRYSPSCLALFLGVDLDLKSRGFDSGNYWYYNQGDMNQAFKVFMDDDAFNEQEFPFFVVTVTSLKDPAMKSKHRHTLEAFTYVPYKLFKKWENSTSGDRPEEYLAFKEQMKERFLDNIEKLIPDIRQGIGFCEMGTPLTNVFYNDATQGNVFGTEKSIFQSGPFSYPMTTEIKNLYMCGASTLAHGVVGALVSGLFASRASLKCGLKDLLKFKDKEITIYQSENMDSWPGRYHQRIAEKWYGQADSSAKTLESQSSECVE